MNLPPDDSFRDLPSLVAEHARRRPEATALIAGDERLSYAELDSLMDRVAASLQRDGLVPCDTMAICATASIAYLALFLGALRAGVAVAPLAPGSTSAQLAGMAADAGAKLVFVDAAVEALGVPWPATARRILLDDGDAASTLSDWLAPAGMRPAAVAIAPHLALQHHLLVGNHRHAQGHRAAARDALGPCAARGDVRLRTRRRHADRHAALLEHDAGRRSSRRSPTAAASC